MQVNWRTLFIVIFSLSLFAFFIILVMIEMPQYFGKFNGFIHDLRTLQRELHQSLAKAVRIMQQQGSGAVLSLIVISFLYGIFHAAGPGHGKLIIATYLATHRTKLKLGIGLSFASAFIQGATAVLLVEVTVKLLNLTLTDTDTAAQSLEIISYALITILGLVLTLVALKKLLHRHSHDGHCDHSHLRYQENLKENIPIVSFISMALSIGIRPCTGSILVLIFATIINLKGAGIVAVFTISFGTAITVSTLAALTVYARTSAEKLLDNMPSDQVGIAKLFNSAALLGGLLIFLFGAALFLSSRIMNEHPIL